MNRDPVRYYSRAEDEEPFTEEGEVHVIFSSEGLGGCLCRGCLCGGSSKSVDLTPFLFLGMFLSMSASKE